MEALALKVNNIGSRCNSIMAKHYIFSFVNFLPWNNIILYGYMAQDHLLLVFSLCYDVKHKNLVQMVKVCQRK